MADNKKYYYLKLKEDFFDSDEMLLLQGMKDGYLYSDILMKMYLRSLKNEGRLMYKDYIPSMMFSDAYMLMKQGVKVKLPNWGGYWYWDAEKKTIMIHTKDGEELDIRQTDRPEYTFDNIASDEWQIADEENCPELGGEAMFGFGDAYKFLERGVKVARKGWNGKGIYLEMQFPDEHSKMTQQYVYIVTTGLVTDNENAPKGLVPWTPSQTDMAAKDWVVFAEE